jgi:hypothetical protein
MQIEDDRWNWSTTANTGGFQPLGALHHVRVHPVKSVNSLFLFDAESTSGVTAGSQILLHGFADGHILDLNLITEFHRRFRRRRVVFLLWQIPFEDGQRSLGLQWQHDIQRDVVGIAVQHPVGEDPEIVGSQILERLLISAGSCIAGLSSADGAELSHVLGMRFDRVGIEVQFPVQSRMDARQMVALQVVINVCLPIALHVIRAALEEFHFREWEFVSLPGQLTQRLKQWCRPRIKIHEHEIEPFFGSYRCQRKVLWTKPLDAFDLSGTDQRAIEVIRPSVICAAKQLARPATLSGRTGAMAAYVIETSQLLIGSADKQQRFARHFGCEVVSGIRYLAAVSHDLPGSGEDLFFLGSEYFRIGVNSGRQCPRILDVALYVKGVGSDFHD